MVKNKYTKKDLKEFDRLLSLTELNGFDNYERNIGRLELNKWLEQWSEKTKKEMFEKIKDW